MSAAKQPKQAERPSSRSAWLAATSRNPDLLPDDRDAALTIALTPGRGLLVERLPPMDPHVIWGLESLGVLEVLIDRDFLTAPSARLIMPEVDQ